MKFKKGQRVRSVKAIFYPMRTIYIPIGTMGEVQAFRETDAAVLVKFDGYLWPKATSMDTIEAIKGD